MKLSYMFHPYSQYAISLFVSLPVLYIQKPGKYATIIVYKNRKDSGIDI